MSRCTADVNDVVQDGCCRKYFITAAAVAGFVVFAGLGIYQVCFNTMVSDKMANMKLQFDGAHSKQIEISRMMRSTKESIKKLELEMDLWSRSIKGLLSQQMISPLIDYALLQAGARILSFTAVEVIEDSKKGYSLLGFPVCRGTSNVELMLQLTTKPGDCWAIKGSEARAIIKLSSLIHVQNVSLEHIPKLQAPLHDISSAPKKFSLWGLESENSDNQHLFGIFEYNNEGSAVQTFPVKNSGLRPYRIVEFKVHSNHGNPHYTCIYKVQVHGEEVSPLQIH